MNVIKGPQYRSDKRRGRPDRRKTPLKHVNVDREQLAWAAGFFDGEGCFCTHFRAKADSHKYTATIGQVDRRVLDHFREAVQLGKIYGPMGPYKGQLPNARPHYKIDIYGFEQVQALLALLWTWLGPVKREQAKSILLRGE